MGADMGNRTQQSTAANRGFTLTELIMVIVIMGIIAAVVAPLIGNKFGAAAQSVKRAGWVQQAEYALTHLRQDLAVSVPNSVFTSETVAGSDQVVEFLSAPVDSELFTARYRNRQLAGQDRLQPKNDISFDLFGAYDTAPAYVSIGNPSALQARQDWEAGPGNSGNLATVSDITAGTGENGNPISNVELTASHDFGDHSPYYRAYFFSGPIAYECDDADNPGFLYRVRGYTSLSTAASYPARTASAIRDRVIRNLQSCGFELIPGTVYSPPALRVRLEIGDSTESIVLYDTIVLRNAS